jgi:16S rRNA A1518/A1519 N6-dimethyltransferase RsmA/KsgA/DIM1 with predicted DNA glycosylase/AP lyase activity
MNPAISRKIKERKVAKDVFYTPEAVAKTHIEQVAKQCEKEYSWLDPFAGKKVYYNNFPVSGSDYSKHNDWTEIDDGKDFFEYDKQVDVICSNPPYSIIDKIIEKSIDLEPKIISYLLLEGKLTPKRLEKLNSAGYGLTGIYICKVYEWYGMATAYTFTKDKPNQADVIYDRIVHHT